MISCIFCSVHATYIRECQLHCGSFAILNVTLLYGHFCMWSNSRIFWSTLITRSCYPLVASQNELNGGQIVAIKPHRGMKVINNFIVNRSCSNWEIGGGIITCRLRSLGMITSEKRWVKLAGAVSWKRGGHGGISMELRRNYLREMSSMGRFPVYSV